MNKKWHKNIFWIIITGLVIANLVVWGGRLFKTKNSRNETMHGLSSGGSLEKPVKLPNFVLKNDNETVINSDGLNARLNVLIFFTLEDCPVCLYEAEFWGEAAQVFRQEDVRFWGITTEKDKNRIQEFTTEYQLTFPIYFDQDGKLKDQILSIADDLKMNITTPFKVFVNRNREVIRIEGPKKNVEEQRLFMEIISRILASKV